MDFPRISTGCATKRAPPPDQRLPAMTLVSRLAALLLAFASLPVFAQAMDPSELPPVDSVFQLSASAPARDRIELRWKIALGSPRR